MVRTLASAWLMASLAGAGVVLTSERLPAGIDPFLAAGAIGVAGSIGCLLLMSLDLALYHRLLDAAFIQGLQLEKEHPWLPQVRHTMQRTQQRFQGVRHSVTAYYGGTAVMPFLLAAALFTLRADTLGLPPLNVAAAFALAGLALGARMRWLARERDLAAMGQPTRAEP